MQCIVCKFGGSATATPEAVRSLCALVRQNKQRRYVVVSAPGRRTKGDDKITDLLLAAYRESLCGKSDAWQQVRSRFFRLADELNVKGMRACLQETERALAEHPYEAFFASRGEYLCAAMLAELLQWPMLDAVGIIRFCGTKANFDASYVTTKEKLALIPYAVIPGFYGSDEKGNVVTFSRGGSDVTGAIVARAVEADLYENWTDVDGVLSANPNYCDRAETIPCLSYEEMKTLSRFGAGVLHEQTVLPVAETGIPIHVRNLFHPEGGGTLVVSEAQRNGGFGINVKEGYRAVLVQTGEEDVFRQAMLVSERFQSFGVSVEYISCGAQSFTLLFRGGDKNVLRHFDCNTPADFVRIQEDLAIVAFSFRQKPPLGRIVTALEESGVELFTIDFGSANHTTFAVRQTQAGEAVRILQHSISNL